MPRLYCLTFASLSLVLAACAQTDVADPAADDGREDLDHVVEWGEPWEDQGGVHLVGYDQSGSEHFLMDVRATDQELIVDMWMSDAGESYEDQKGYIRLTPEGDFDYDAWGDPDALYEVIDLLGDLEIKLQDDVDAEDLLGDRAEEEGVGFRDCLPWVLDKTLPKTCDGLRDFGTYGAYVYGGAAAYSSIFLVATVASGPPAWIVAAVVGGIGFESFRASFDRGRFGCDEKAPDAPVDYCPGDDD